MNIDYEYLSVPYMSITGFKHASTYAKYLTAKHKSMYVYIYLSTNLPAFGVNIQQYIINFDIFIESHQLSNILVDKSLQRILHDRFTWTKYKG